MVFCKGFLYGIQAGIAPSFIDRAVDVVGIEDDQILFRKRFCSGEGDTARQQRDDQQKREYLFHSQSDPFHIDSLFLFTLFPVRIFRRFILPYPTGSIFSVRLFKL